LLAAVLAAGQASGAGAAPDDAPTAAGCGRAWLWMGGSVGAAGVGLAALAWWLRRSSMARAPRPADLSPYPKPPPTLPGAPAIANPFATLPDTRLVIVRGLPLADRFYRISTSPFTVGADPGNHLVIDAPHVSSLHATLELLDDGTVHLVDASRNGTYIDGTRVPTGERVRVNPGQRIEFSRDVEVQLEQPSRQAPVHAAVPVVSPAEPNPARKAETTVERPKLWREDR